MPAPRKAKERIYSKKYGVGYLEDIRGIYHTRIGDERRTTRLRAIPENEADALEILEARAFEYLHPELSAKEIEPELPPFNTVWELVREYKTAQFQALKSDNVREMFTKGIKFYFKKNVALEYTALFEHINTINRTSDAANETRRKYLLQLRRLFDFGVKHKAIDRNPLLTIGIPFKIKKNEDDKVIIEPEKFEKFLQAIRSKKHPTKTGEKFLKEQSEQNELYALAYEFLYYTMMRVGESLKLYRNIHIKPDRIKIPGKGGVVREFPLEDFPKIIELLKKLEPYTSHGGKLFPWKSPSKLEKYLREVRDRDESKLPEPERVGLDPNTVLHSLRASGEWYYENVEFLDYDVICDLAGHSAKVRDDHYRQTRKAENISAAIKKRKNSR